MGKATTWIREFKYAYVIIQKILEKYKSDPIYDNLRDISLKFVNLHPHGDPHLWSRLAKLTEKINFDCKFNEKGGCKNHSKYITCCCSGCSGSVGHFTYRNFDSHTPKEKIENILLFYAKNFDEQDGFWREGKGCILPREKRSQICLTYNCGYIPSPEERTLESLLRYWNDTPSPIRYSILQILEKHFENV